MALLVNGEPVTEDAIARQLQMLQASLQQGPGTSIDPRLYAVAEENALLQVLLRQAAAAHFPEVSEEDISAEIARRRGTPQSTTCGPSERAAILRALQIDRLLDKVTRQVPRPPTREVEAVYKAQRERFRMPETLHVRHIIANLDGRRDEAAAMTILVDAREALDAGEPFPRVADRFSDCGGVGGDLGWIARGEMVEEFDAVVFAMKPGAVSEIFRTIFGFHIATVVARRAEHQLPFSEVRSQIASELHEERRQEAVVHYLRGLAGRSEVRRIGVPA